MQSIEWNCLPNKHCNSTPANMKRKQQPEMKPQVQSNSGQTFELLRFKILETIINFNQHIGANINSLSSTQT